jgi:hypothetical protein
MKKRYHYTDLANISKESKRDRFFLRILFVSFLSLLFFTKPVLAQSVVTVFSENFDNATSTQPWSPYFSSGWWNSNTTLESISGKGKVLRTNFPSGTVGDSHGFGNYRIPLDSAYKELYLSWEYFLPSTFDLGYADGLGGGKFFGGFAGGSMTAIPNNDATDVDGWVSMFIFQNGNYRTYNYFKGTSYSGGWPTGSLVTDLIKGQWRRITIRMKINDGDQSNGIFEVFDNDKLVYQQTNAKIVNSSHPEYLIEHIYLNSFFGGSGTSYASPITQYMQFDNLIAFYYPKSSAGYRSGSSEAGRVLQVPQATASYHPMPPNKFTPGNYTDASGTISSHCGFYQPVNHSESFETSTIQVSGASSISINVTKFVYDGGISYSGYKQTLKIYQGVGTSRVLKQTYMNGTYTTPGTISISGNSATIEWQAGQGSHNGFSLNYTSNGSGAGRNYVCRNCNAKQGSPGTVSATLPTAPAGLAFANLTDVSLTLNWKDNSTNETGFEIERVGPTGTSIITSFTAGVNVTTLANTDLIGKSTYTYRVRSYNASGYSAYSSPLSVTTNQSLPRAPSLLISSTQTTNSIGLSWTDNSSIEQGFRMERSLSATTGFAEIAVIPSNTTNYTDPSLVAGTNYYYRIRAYNEAGNSAYTSVVQVLTAGLNGPLAPGALTASKIAYTSASVLWTDNATNETGFDLERSGPNDLTIKNTISLPVNTVTYDDNGLVSNGTYQYRVRSKNNTGASGWSNVVEIKTQVAGSTVNNPPIISDQKFTVFEKDYSNSVIGTVTSTDPDAGQQLTYSIASGNTAGLFEIDSKTGVLKATQLNIFGSGTFNYTLTVQVTDNASAPKSASANVSVKLVGNSKTVHIDPANTTDLLANGSVSHPYSSWDQITWLEGYSYLQKKGTTAKVDKIQIGANDVTIGSYGEGDLPVISSETNTYLLSGFEKSGIKIDQVNLQAPKAVSCVYFLGSSNDTISISQSIIVGNTNGIKLVDAQTFVSKYNTITSNHEGVFTTAVNNEIYYNIFEKCSTAVNIMGNKAQAKIYNNVFIDNKESLAISYAELTLYNNIFYLNEPGQIALNHGTGKVSSDHNIYYPEQEGFVKVNKTSFNNLDEVQQSLKIDMNSFNSDPQFVDIYKRNFSVKSSSPAINAGVNLKSAGHDFKGSKVPLFDIADIGAFEYNGNMMGSTNPEETSTIELYPNPTRGEVSVFAKLKNDMIDNEPFVGQAFIRVLDITGKVMFSKVLSSTGGSNYEERIDMSAFSNGLYFIVFQLADKVIKEKLILNK